MSLAVRSALKELHRSLSLVAIITGRSARQARDIVGLREMLYVGNHGLERLQGEQFTLMEEAQLFAPYLLQLLVRLRAVLLDAEVTFEDKVCSFALHYRAARHPIEAQRLALKAIQELAGDEVRILMGKEVINVLPPVNLTKGTAVSSLVREFGLAGAILIGDDVTDLDSFRAARDLSGQPGFQTICVAVVGPDSPSELEREADFTLSNVSEVERFLIWLAGEPR